VREQRGVQRDGDRQLRDREHQSTGGSGSGSLFPVGKTTNSFSVVDASGNSNVCTSS